MALGPLLRARGDRDPERKVLVQPGPKVVTLSRAAADKVESDAKAAALLAAVGYLAGSDWAAIVRAAFKDVEGSEDAREREEEHVN